MHLFVSCPSQKMNINVKWCYYIFSVKFVLYFMFYRESFNWESCLAKDVYHHMWEIIIAHLLFSIRMVFLLINWTDSKYTDSNFFNQTLSHPSPEIIFCSNRDITISCTRGPLQNLHLYKILTTSNQRGCFVMLRLQTGDICIIQKTVQYDNILQAQLKLTTDNYISTQ